MCKWGTYDYVYVTIPADLACEGIEKVKRKPIDRCIAPIVQALELGKIKMRGSCCGHGKHDGYIDLQDGRTIVILPKGNKFVTEL